MVSKTVRDKIESLKKGDIVYVKNQQRTYYSNDERLSPDIPVTVNNPAAPYIRKLKDKHQCFLAGLVNIDGEEFCCGIDYENIDIGRAERREDADSTLKVN